MYKLILSLHEASYKKCSKAHLNEETFDQIVNMTKNITGFDSRCYKHVFVGKILTFYRPHKMDALISDTS